MFNEREGTPRLASVVCACVPRVCVSFLLGAPFALGSCLGSRLSKGAHAQQARHTPQYQYLDKSRKPRTTLLPSLWWFTVDEKKQEAEKANSTLEKHVQHAHTPNTVSTTHERATRTNFETHYYLSTGRPEQPDNQQPAALSPWLQAGSVKAAQSLPLRVVYPVPWRRTSSPWQ